MKNNLFISILSVVAIIALTVGVTYAYYESSDTATIGGTAKEGLSSSITLEAIKTSSNLVPLVDSKITTAISKSEGKCVDKNNYDVCNLYKVTMSNTGASESLYGYLKTTSNTYTTNNLKFQIFNASFSASSDVMNVSRTTNEIVYFKSGTNNLVYNSSGTSVFYIAIWLSDSQSEQSSDYSKTFNGAVGIELVGGFSSARVEASLS